MAHAGQAPEASGGRAGAGWSGIARFLSLWIALGTSVLAHPALALYVDISAPASGTTFAAPATIAISADAFPGTYTVPIVKVEFFQGSALIGTDTTAPYGVTWSNVPAGSYTLTAKVTDSSGDTRISDEVIVTVNSSAAQMYYIVPDHLNTPRMIANQAGTTVWRWDNTEPFGNSMPNDDPDADGVPFVFDLRFPGQYFDRETNLAYNYFRDCYDPATGRFCQADPIAVLGIAAQYGIVDLRPLWALPINPSEIADDETIEMVRRATAPELSYVSDFNLYAYVGGNPLLYRDPLGLAQQPKPAPPPGGGKPTIPPPQGPPPDAPPPPGFGCGAAFRICTAFCIQRCPGGILGKTACEIGCVALYIACLTRGH